MHARPGVLLACLAVGIAAGACRSSAGTERVCRVERIVDGDTLYVSCLDESVRLLLIDTPEVGPDGSSADEGECYGAEATDYLESRLPEGTVVRLEAGVVDRDQYGRYLRYLFLDDELINETLVREGYAIRYRQAEDTTYRARITAAEDLARREGGGLWGACPAPRS